MKLIYKHLFDNANSILAIPKKYFYIEIDGKPLYYYLQRRATFYKKNNQLDMAIACLRKSNEISDTYDHLPLLDKDYLRLPKYIKLTGDLDLARYEEELIYQHHPEFINKCISNKKRYDEIIKNSHEWNEDLIYVTSTNRCPICSKYNKQIYSISGKSTKYKKVPIELTEGGICKEHIISFFVHFEL